MANIRSCNKHNMIACVEKTAQNADFYQIIDFLTGCSINYSLLVDPDLIGPWLQQFWATATLKVINDVPHIRAKVAGKKILISEATIRADLLFDDENGVDCFPKQVIWDVLRDIGYRGPKALHGNTIWDKKSASGLLVGLATNQMFNLSLMFLTGIAEDIFQNGTPFFFVLLQCLRKHSTKFSCRITPLTPSMLEVVTALAAEEEQSTSPHSRAASYARDAQGTPTKSVSIPKVLLFLYVLLLYMVNASFHGTVNSQGTADIQRTADFQGTAEPHDAASIPKSPNDYTPTDVFQTLEEMRAF
ncbi:hypothetical protein Tco_0792498 [Tanacetum coccineum]